MSGYENGKTALTPEMVDKFAKALEVSADEIEITDDSFNEDAPAYRTNSIPVDILPNYMLDQIVKYLSAEIPNVTGAEFSKIMEAIQAAKHELHSRPVEISSVPIPEDHRKAIEAAEAAVDHGPQGSRAAFPTGAPSGGTLPPSRESSRGSKAKPPTPPGKAHT